MQSTFWMDRALALAAQGRGMTAPNPAVGAVLVKEGRLLGEGFHRGPGWPHAEAAALDQAKSRGHDPRGGVLYVTLEPCCHTGPAKRTPPCAQRLIAEGIAEVWAAVPDPNPLVAGRGRRLLEQAGIRFQWGPRAEKGRDLIADFSAWLDGRPFVTLKWAQSLDGRLVGSVPGSPWITGTSARAEAHRLRADHDAVAVGAGTLRTDNPALTVREAALARSGPPRRLIFAGAKPLPADSRVFRDDQRSSTWIVAAPGSAAWTQASVLVNDRKILWDGQAETLGARLLKAGFHRILVEGGPTLLSFFLRQSLWDRAEIFTAPLLLGGPDSSPSPLNSLMLSDPLWKTAGSDTWLGGWNPRVREALCLPA